jgi:hypothetical protein
MNLSVTCVIRHHMRHTPVCKMQEQFSRQPIRPGIMVELNIQEPLFFWPSSANLDNCHTFLGISEAVIGTLSIGCM